MTPVKLDSNQTLVLILELTPVEINQFLSTPSVTEGLNPVELD